MSVPPYPGVPPLLETSNPFEIVTLLSGQEPAPAPADPQPWGIFDAEGNLVLSPDNIPRMGYRRNYRASGFPIEGGKFENYNKVAMPFEVRLTMTKSGSPQDKSQFIAQLEAVAASLELYTIVTPEVDYPDVNVLDIGYDRSAVAGAQMITFELLIQQIRIATDAVPTDSRTLTTQNNGAVQTQTPTAAQQTAIGPPA